MTVAVSSYQRALAEPAHALAIYRTWVDAEKYARELREQSTVLLGEARAIEQRVEVEREAVRQAMLDTGLTAFTVQDDGVERSFVLEANRAPVELLCDPALLPDRFTRIKVEVDKVALAAALKAGDPEAVAVARFGERSMRLAVK